MTSSADKAPFKSGTTFRSAILPILFITSLFFLNFIARIIPAPLLPTIEDDLGIGHGQAGSLFLIISTGYFVTLIGSGFFSSRFSHKKTIVLSAIVLGLALVAASFSASLWALRVGLLFIGLATGIYLPSGIASVTSLVDKRDWGKAVAIHELAPNLSFIAAPLIAEMLLLILPWRGVFLLIGLLSIGLGLAFASLGRGGRFPGEAPSFSAMRILLRESSFWIMLVLFSLGISITIGIYTMLPLFLVSEHELPRSLANTVTSLSRISCIFMAFVGGYASDRFGAGRTVGAVLVLGGLITVVMGSITGYGIIPAVFVQPMIGACFFPAGFAALSSIGPANIRNVTVSMTIPVAFVLGAGIIPAAIGFAGELGFFGLAISLVGLLSIMAAGLTHFLCIGSR